MTTVTATNAYWDAVKDHVDRSGSLWDTPSVGGLSRYRSRSGDLDIDRWMVEVPQRHEFVARYSWTITDPATVAFIVEHSGGAMVDPMAGTGWWAHVLAEHGVDVACYDIAPGANHWHEGQQLHVPVTEMDGVAAVRQHADRALFLSWPPYDKPDGVEVVRAYAGSRVILIGESEGGCTGDDALFEELDANWVEVGEHVPVQWDGLHDIVRVFDRKV